jgi:WD40 repeat protein
VIPDSPYKGLVPFEDTELDALLFFGRERESGIISENVLAARLTVLYGPSGVGKTSVLRAGVAHHLRQQARRNLADRGHPEYAVVVFDAWSDDPVGSLRVAVRDELAAQFGSALLDEREGESLADTFGRWTEGLACDLLVILDQAEEYFLYHQGEGGFAVELPDLVTRPGLRVRVLLSLRDDALAKLDRFKGSIPNLFANYLRLDHLDRRAAAEAVVRPVERFNELTGERIEVEPELVDAVLDETAAGQVELAAGGQGVALADEAATRIEAAYLQLVLQRLWEDERAMGSSRLRVSTLAALGGADAIMREHLRRAVEALSADEKDVAADVFRFLVTPSGSKIAHGASDLAEYASVGEERMLPVLSTLGRERIVRTVDGSATGGARYEIFHDVLGQPVLAWRREQELARERRAAERRHRRLAIVAVAALLALAAMTAVAIYALSQRHEALSQRREARSAARGAESRELVARSSGMLDRDPLESIGLAAQAARLDPTAEAQGALRNALLSSHLLRILRAGAGGVNAATYNGASTLVATADADGTAHLFSTANGSTVATLSHAKGVTDVAFSPDDSMVATASRDRTVKLWNLEGGPIRTLPHDAAVLDLAFSPDRRFLVSTTAAGSVYIWGLDHTGPPRVITTPGPERIALSAEGDFGAFVGAGRFARVYDLSAGAHLYDLDHGSQVLSAAFGPHKELLATGSANWRAQTWDLRTGRRAYPLTGHFGRVVDVAVSPQGQFVGTASADGTARVWNIATRRGALQSILMGHTDQLHSIEFSPRGLYVLTASRDGTARVWLTDRGRPVSVLTGHDGDVRGATFNATGRRVLTYGEDGTARIWDPGTTAELRVLSHEKTSVVRLDVAREGRLRVTTDEGGTARLWSGAARPVVLPVRRVRDVKFSPDGALVATVSADGAVHTWTIRGAPRRTIRSPGPLAALAFTPDGQTLAAAGSKGVLVWRVDDGKQQGSIRTGPGIVDLSFSPDGAHLVTAGADGVARTWNVDTGRLEHVLTGHRDRLTSAKFSPDGTLIVTASADHDAIVWNAKTGALEHRLRAHGAIVSDAGFSSDGRWIVTAGPGTAGLWEVRTGRLLSLLRGHVGILSAAQFEPAGYTVFTAGEDGTVRTYSCEVCGRLPDLLSLAGRRLASVGDTRR